MTLAFQGSNAWQSGNLAARNSAVHCHAVSKHYGAVQALADFNLEVPPGKLVAVLGPNGAGKTTAIKLLLGLVRPSSGRLSVFGGDPSSRATHTRIGAMLQVGRVPETLKVSEHIDLFSSYYPKPLPISKTLAIAGLESLRHRRFGALSSGQKQRVLFALAICGDPDLLFLDEPTVGLDVEARHQLWQEIRELLGRGKTVLLTTHYLEEADALADRILVLNHGRVIAEGSPAEIKTRTAGKKIRCRTNLSPELVRTLPGVLEVNEDRKESVIHCSQAEPVLRQLLELDVELSGLEVTSAGLEDAFLALTQNHSPQSETGAQRSSGNRSRKQPGGQQFRQEARIMASGSVAISVPVRQSPNLITICAKEAKYEFLKCLRFPMYSVSTLVLPLMFYALFGLIMGKQVVGQISTALYMIPTYGTFGVMGASLFGTAANLATERGLGWLEVKRSSPMPVFAYFLAKVILSLLFSLIDVVLLLLLGAAFGGVHLSWLIAVKLVGTLVAGALPFCAMGLAIGYLAGPNSAPAVINLFYLPLSFSSGLWIPFMFLPKFVQKIGVFLPPYHLSQLALSLVKSGRAGTAGGHWQSLAGFALLCLGIAWAGHQRDQKANG